LGTKVSKGFEIKHAKMDEVVLAFIHQIIQGIARVLCCFYRIKGIKIALRILVLSNGFG